ncbi:ATP-binding protein [Nocardioides marmotae]|uniref:ATP-binding protein n=1 Tax=Nocardioides marmotae TaxID=2663857 RepID=UPI0012B5C2C4|nr:ATP-binding protein [Nocardioides marmotae]MBC9735124.1 response regulator [Nocardioides marmotae]MTB86224.1 response regulator [Nocardioides marmotae]
MGTSLSLGAQRRRFRLVVPIAVAFVVVFAILLQPGFPRGFREVASSLGLLISGIATAVSLWLRTRRSTGRRRRAWQWLLAASVTAVVGNVWMAVVGAQPVDDPSLVSDLSVALALALSIVGMLTFPAARRRGRNLAIMVLDGTVGGAAVLIMASVLVYDELLASVDHVLGSEFFSVLIPFLDIALVTFGLLLVLRSRGESRPALALVALGFLLYAVADLSFAVRVAQGTFAWGDLPDLGWIAGYLIIGVAAWYPLHPDAPDVEEQRATADTRDTVLVYSAVGVAAVVQTMLNGGDAIQRAQVLLWLLLGLAAGLRQVLLTADNAQLRRGLERQVAEQTSDLRRMARRTETLITSVGDGIYGVDAAGRITFVNPSGAEALRQSPDALLGQDAHALFHAPTADGAAYPYDGCYVAEAIASGIVTNAEEDVYVRADGTRFPVEITASPLIDDDEVTGAVVVFRDVTQRQEVDRMKNEFLSVVSHELRTPLTSIRGSLGLLAGGQLGELSPRATSMARIALESTERLTRLINDILDLERIESGTRPMELAPTDVRSVVEAAVGEMDAMARGAGVELVVGETAGQVLVDSDRVVQTLTNLVNNAVKFSTAGGQVVVDAVPQPSGTTVLFRVRDQGRGIPTDQLTTIFDRFHQVDSSDARQKGGTGLGLAISRSIVERHGGRIWAESSPGEGTTVQFTLPLHQRTPATGATGDAPAVLVCDDEPAVVGALSSMLEQHGYRPVGVGDGDAAIARATADRPAAVLVDLRMPGTSGADVVAELRRGERTRTIPLIVLSGLGPETAPELGPQTDGWLVKPVTEEQLVAAVEIALAGRLRESAVLVVEDDEDLAEVICTPLRGHGIRVDHASTAAAAIEAGRRLRPQVVVLDLHLPDDDGSAVIAAFRADPALRATPLVVYSAADVEVERRADLELGPTVFLTKGRSGPDALEERVLGLLDAVVGRAAEQDPTPPSDPAPDPATIPRTPPRAPHPAPVLQEER